MSRRAAIVLIAAVCVLALALVWWWQTRARPRQVSAAGAPAAIAVGPLAPAVVTLYFPGADGRLYAEARELELSAIPEYRLDAIIRSLLAGPRGESLSPPLPASVQLAGVVIGEDGVGYIDLRNQDGSPPPPSGSLREMLTVYSIVDTAVENIPQVRRVVLLWNGVQPLTFAGHLATDRPLAPNREFIANEPGRETGAAP